MSHNGNAGVMGGGWFLGFVGALIYFLQHASTFWLGIVGFLKAIVWPAYLVYHLFVFLHI